MTLDISTSSGQVSAPSAAAMRELGERIGEQLQAGTVVVLTGPLGAGKTTLTQGIARGLGVRGRVQSPTFAIVRHHPPAAGASRADGSGQAPGLLHMDAYRLLGADVADSLAPGEQVSRDVVLDALESLDVDLDLDGHVVVAEWGRGVVETLSERVLDIEIARRTGDSMPADPVASATKDEEFCLDDDPRELRWRWL